jgi:acylphosphatase
MPANPAHQRKHILYRGHVQGVGFRFTTQSIAKRYDVTGFVRNLPDGQVELVVEGERHELNAFLDDVRERLVNHIREERPDTQPATGEFATFEIRR